MVRNPGENNPQDASQLSAVERMQMTQAVVLAESGIFTKGLMHIVERSGGRQVEDQLEAGLPLIICSQAKDFSYAYLGIRYMREDGFATKLVPLARKAMGSDRYSPIEMTRFTEDDCRIVELLLEEAEQLVLEEAPDYNLEVALLWH